MTVKGQIFLGSEDFMARIGQRVKFLLKFLRDRRPYLHWVFQAKKRFDLAVLNYTVTSNHSTSW